MKPHKPIDPKTTRWNQCMSQICEHCKNEYHYGGYAHLMEECTHRDEPGFPAYPFKMMAENFAKRIQKIINVATIKERLGIK